MELMVLVEKVMVVQVVVHKVVGQTHLMVQDIYKVHMVVLQVILFLQVEQLIQAEVAVDNQEIEVMVQIMVQVEVE